MKIEDSIEALYYLGAYSSILNNNGLSDEKSTGLVFLPDGVSLRSNYERIKTDDADLDLIKVHYSRNGKKVFRYDFTGEAFSKEPLDSENISDSDKRTLIALNAPTEVERNRNLMQVEKILTDEEALNLLFAAEDVIDVKEPQTQKTK
jgi:hypothetical protein